MQEDCKHHESVTSSFQPFGWMEADAKCLSQATGLGRHPKLGSGVERCSTGLLRLEPACWGPLLKQPHTHRGQGAQHHPRTSTGCIDIASSHRKKKLKWLGKKQQGELSSSAMHYFDLYQWSICLTVLSLLIYLIEGSVCLQGKKKLYPISSFKSENKFFVLVPVPIRK